MVHLLEGPVYGHITEDRRTKKPSTRRESKPRPLEFHSVGLHSTAVLQLLPTQSDISFRLN